ncbi:hypothetical protein A2859_01240 [Candidatus Roizmanbacteria bacterium RIFCSPHIGHO2_01_FULL_37_16b]|nr:MAG: hypothetical protein A2859_01240 [Candidatus Roizmanbacteria bacterium RIFCSPHIGHO2_01_FULL_37_16b]
MIYFDKYKKKILLIILSFIYLLILNYNLYINKFNPILIIVWIASIILFISPFINGVLSYFSRLRISKNTFVVTSVIFLPSIIRVLIILTLRRLWIHQDDMISAYFSAKYDLTGTNFFGPLPLDKGDWVSQFPAVYHFLQKIFFMIFGESLMSVKLSTIPYVIITSFFLYLTVKLLFNRRTAVVSLMLYAFFPISLYHETLGLHINASSAVFMLFCFFLVIYFRYKQKIYAVLTGIACAFNFLFYPSSYIALPLMFILFFLDFLNQRKRYVVINLLLASFSFIFTVSPFLTYMYQAKNFYITQRFDQVNLLMGEHSELKDRINKGENIIRVLGDNFIKSVKSMYVDGIGGHGGYDFGYLAFFEKISLLFFIFGVFFSLYSIKKKFELMMIFIIIFITFFSGVVLTDMPPAYQRLLIAVPFIIIVTSGLFYFLEYYFEKNNGRKRYWFRIFFTAFLLIVYSSNNYFYFLKSIEKEKERVEVKIGNFIAQNYPVRKIYIAAFRTFALNKTFYFFGKENMKKTYSDYHDELLADFNPNEKYVYVLTYPDAFNDKFQEMDKNAKIINFSENFSLFVN